MEKTKLNLGCGKDIKEGYVNVDSVKLSGVDVIQELSDYPWKFKDNEFDEVYARFILEHLPDNIKVMEEIWRISKPGAIIKIWVPHFSSDYCWGDIQHMRGYTLISFDIFLESCPYNFYNKCHFKILRNL